MARLATCQRRKRMNVCFFLLFARAWRFANFARLYRSAKLPKVISSRKKRFCLYRGPPNRQGEKWVFVQYTNLRTEKTISPDQNSFRGNVISAGKINSPGTGHAVRRPVSPIRPLIKVSEFGPWLQYSSHV